MDVDIDDRERGRVGGDPKREHEHCKALTLGLLGSTDGRIGVRFPTLYYSRRIGCSPQGFAAGDFVDSPTATTILGAGKLTGRPASGWNLTALDVLTSREYADAATNTD